MPDSITSNSPSSFLDRSLDTIATLGREAVDTYDTGKQAVEEFASERKDEVVEHGMDFLSGIDFLADEQVSRLENATVGYDEKTQLKKPIFEAQALGCSMSATVVGTKSEKNPDKLTMSALASVSCKLDDLPITLGFEAKTKVSVDKEILKDPSIGNLIRTGQEISVEAGPIESVTFEKGVLGASASFKQKAGLTFDREGLKSVDISESHGTSVTGGIGFGQEVGDIDTDYFELTGSLGTNSGVSFGRDEVVFKTNTELGIEAGGEKLFVDLEIETNGTDSKVTPSAGHYDWQKSTNIDVKGYGYSNESVKKISDFATVLNF